MAMLNNHMVYLFVCFFVCFCLLINTYYLFTWFSLLKWPSIGFQAVKISVAGLNAHEREGGVETPCRDHKTLMWLFRMLRLEVSQRCFCSVCTCGNHCKSQEMWIPRYYICTGWCPPSDVCGFIYPMNTIVISAINHSYGTYKPT